MQKILVVDDNASNRLLPGLILRPFGFDVIEVASGQAALSVLKNEAVAGVLLDIQMQGKNGLEVLRDIRSEPLLKGLKVIAYTGAYTTQNDIDNLTAQGFDAVLLKPIKSTDLLKILIT